MSGKSYDDDVLLAATDGLPRQTNGKSGNATAGEDLGPCASRVFPKGWLGLRVENALVDGKRCAAMGFQYCHLGVSLYEEDGTEFVVEFDHREKWKITVKGRNLWEIYINIHHQKVEWIKVADRDFAQGNEKIITSITIEKIEEEA